MPDGEVSRRLTHAQSAEVRIDRFQRASLLRWAQAVKHSPTDAPWSWSTTRPVWIALGITVILAVVAASDYRLNNPERKQVAADVTTQTAMPVPAPLQSAAEPTKGGLAPPYDQPRRAEATTPPTAASTAVAASEPSPTVLSSAPPTTEQLAPGVLPAEASPIPTKKPVAGLYGTDVFVVRFDSKLPGLTPSGIRALDAAVRAAHAGRKVQIAIEGCDSGESASNGLACAERVSRLKGFLADMGVHHPAGLIAGSFHP